MTKTDQESIDIHIRTYRSALRSSNEISLETLTPTYLKINPLIHLKASSENEIDLEALFYAFNRFPKEILSTKKVIIGQTKSLFEDHGFDLSTWKKVSAPRRRRRYFFDNKTKTLACFSASISDVDDIVNLALAFQVEFNKIFIMNGSKGLDKNVEEKIKLSFPLPKNKKSLKIRLLAGTWVNFAKTTQSWWKTIIRKAGNNFNLVEKPLVFVSSNNHGLINTLDNFCLENKKEILKLLKKDYPRVNEEIKSFKEPFNIYYASQFIFQKHPKLWGKKLKREKTLGILRIKPQTDLPLETQLIPGKILGEKFKNLTILNVEYPLGFSAFHLLEEILENVQEIIGVYILGKAAALNTQTGDILIPKIVFDEHTENTYMIKNSFNNNFPFQMTEGSVLDNQKLASVLGTILENKDLLDAYSKKEFNIVEMEAGPYLGAITQASYAKPVPQRTIVDLHQPPLDLGLIYYSSDSPYILSKTLGEFLGPVGIEATYLASRAIIDRIKKIFQTEESA